ncbi:pescadillo homolog, putative [Plasmodium relictum]|uniref:Pescadillo homolog n=1 Tax=Plasmodium relictum TaxID=85471 RepID=A0A1J1H5I6_PLARL|nr:pescadillo homolog, putative [Plasmodium relictum]CRG99953.1 pescadillo homolog, putative [Plasmodium relictum]
MHIHKLRKKIKKKKEGNYLTKKNIIRKLYLNEDEFRKLCIFKGIYPKDYKEIPLKYRKKFYKHKIFYTRNDYLKLSHEKIIQDFRKIKIFLRKYKKFKIVMEDEARSKNIVSNFPKYKLDHIIKERFPVLSYAVEQLDDSLSAVIAYSLLPSNEKLGIKNNLVKLCEDLKNHFHYYIYKTKKIKKAFISVKGYYLQAEILQKKVTWIVPHIYTPYLSKSIDFRLITTFIEYYVSLLKFVLYKLYKLDNLQYPPEENETLKNEKFKHLAYDPYFISIYEAKKNDLEKKKEKKDNKCSREKQRKIKKKGICDKEKENDNALVVNKKNKVNSKKNDDHKDNDKIVPKSLQNDKKAQSEKENKNENNEILKNNEENENKNTPVKHNINDEDNINELFKNYIFYIHNDMPFYILSIIILSCGGQICWKNLYSPFKYESKKITHEIVEAHESIILNEFKYKRNIIQPQYVFDCLNRRKILPCSDYSIDKNLPVHLSPFIEDDNYKNFVKKEEYTINKMLIKNEGNEEKKDSNENDDDEILNSEDELNDAILENHRNVALNNQIELENEDKDTDAIKKKKDLNIYNIKNLKKQEELQRNKIALSKKKRKLYSRIERAEKKQNSKVEKFLKKAKNKKGKNK